MPRIAKADAALRRIVLDSNAALKTRISALKAIATPSSTFLSELVSDREIHPKLVAIAAELLAALEQARKHRAEVDRILAEETQRLEKRDPNKNNIPPVVQAPAPVIPETKPRPENGVGRHTRYLGERMERIQTLAEIAGDQTRDRTDKDIAMTALKDISVSASTAHERQTAERVLKSLASGSTDSKIPCSDEMLRILFLLDRDWRIDSDENNALARERYYKSIQQ